MKLVVYDGLALVIEKSRRENPHKDGKVAMNHEYEHRHFLHLLAQAEKYEATEDVEYAAFGFDVDKQEYVRIGRPVGTELLCRARLNEAAEKGWIPESVDCTRVIIRKRKVLTCTGEWEAIQ